MEAGCWGGRDITQSRHRDAVGTAKFSSRHPDNFMRLVPPFFHFRDKDRFCGLYQTVSSDVQSAVMFGTLGLSLDFATYVTWRKALNIFSSLFACLYNKENNDIYVMELGCRGNKWVYAQPLQLGLSSKELCVFLWSLFVFSQGRSLKLT